MPKHTNSWAKKNNRLARHASQVDSKRSDLLREILEESSSISLNDGTNQPSARQALDGHSRLFELIGELRHVEGNSNPELPSRDAKSWENFFRWLDANSEDIKQKKLSDSIGVKSQSLTCCANNSSSVHDDEEECSLIAKIPFQKGDKIFNIDREMMLSTETAVKDQDLFDFIMNDSIASAMQNVVLVLHLLNEYSKGDKSHWSPYLAILPRKILPVLKLNKKNLNCLSASSHIFEALKMIRAIARQYTYFFKRLQSTELPLKKDFTFEYYCWGVSIVCSRQNEIPPFDRQAWPSPVIHALIPILDMCNHDRQSNQAIFEDNQSCLLACTDLKSNDEITINYGCRSSGEFYIHNGFVPDEVPFDILPLKIVLDKQESLFERKAKLLKTLNMPIFGRFKLTYNNYENRHKRDPHLTMFLIVYFLSEQELEFISNSENPVGIADEIYEYIQYNQYAIDSSPSTVGQKGENSGQESSFPQTNKEMITSLKERLTNCVKDYLSKRASVGIALIDRALLSNGMEERLDVNTYILLKHERSIYASHLITCEAK